MRINPALLGSSKPRASVSCANFGRMNGGGKRFRGGDVCTLRIHQQQPNPSKVQPLRDPAVLLSQQVSDAVQDTSDSCNADAREVERTMATILALLPDMRDVLMIRASNELDLLTVESILESPTFISSGRQETEIKSILRALISRAEREEEDEEDARRLLLSKVLNALLGFNNKCFVASSSVTDAATLGHAASKEVRKYRIAYRQKAVQRLHQSLRCAVKLQAADDEPFAFEEPPSTPGLSAADVEATVGGNQADAGIRGDQVEAVVGGSQAEVEAGVGGGQDDSGLRGDQVDSGVGGGQANAGVGGGQDNAGFRGDQVEAGPCQPSTHQPGRKLAEQIVLLRTCLSGNLSQILYQHPTLLLVEPSSVKQLLHQRQQDAQLNEADTHAQDVESVELASLLKLDASS